MRLGITEIDVAAAVGNRTTGSRVNIHMGRGSQMFLAMCVVLGCSAQPPRPPSTEAMSPHRPHPRPVAMPVQPAVDAEATAPPTEAEPESPPPFDGETEVPLSGLVQELEGIATQMEGNASVRADYEALVRSHDLADSADLYRDFVRVKLVFESTRDGGLWQLAWKITNEKPNSEKIWGQWSEGPDPGADDSIAPTAWAECDELSALFAFIARRLGVDKIGLFWPTWNHVVAVWTVPGRNEQQVRIVVPTSQIFLGQDATLGTNEFDPWKQKTIYTYKRKDAKPSRKLPVDLARFFVVQSRTYAHRPTLELQGDRNQRSAILGGS